MGRRSDVDGRGLLLEAALKLFAEQGVDSVSIRAVNREAGLGPASVHYHFGTKEALVDAVLHTYGSSVIQDFKARAVEIAAQTGEPVTARDLVTMLAQPYLDLMATRTGSGRAWVRLVGQLLHSEPDRILDRPSARLMWAAAARVYPHASPADVRRAMRMCFTLLVSQLAQAGAGPRRTLDADLLVDFLSGGLDAALTRKAPGQAARTRHPKTA